MRHLSNFDAFLSHSHKDAEWVEYLARRLEDEKDVRVWLDKWLLVPGTHWQQAIARSLDEVSSCAIIVGENTPAGWFREEIQRALNRQTKDETFRVIPVLTPKGSPEKLPEFVELRTWADFRSGCDEEYALHVLTQGIRGLPVGRWIPVASQKSQEQLQKEILKRKLQDLNELSALLKEEVTVKVQMDLVNRYMDQM